MMMFHNFYTSMWLRQYRSKALAKIYRLSVFILHESRTKARNLQHFDESKWLRQISKSMNSVYFCWRGSVPTYLFLFVVFCCAI